MFTGLIEAIGAIAATHEKSAGRRLTVKAEILAESAIGDSIAINGCCLTIVLQINDSAEFEAGPETLRKTNLGELRSGDQVNIERALAAGARLGGHFVQGHVDGTGEIHSRERDGEWETVWFTAGELARSLIPKGSVAVDGISLTVVDVTPDAFSVALIPHTLAATTLGRKQVGATVNLETDVLGKYVMAYLKQLDIPVGAPALTGPSFLPKTG